MKRLAGYLKHYLLEVILAPMLRLIETVAELIIPMLVAAMIDVGVSNKDIKLIYTYGGIVLALNVVGIICAIVCQKMAAKASSGVAVRLRSDLFSHITTFSHAEIDKYSTATLNNRLTHDVTRIRQAISQVIRTVTRIPFLLIGSLIMALTINLKLSLIFLVVAPIIFAVVWFLLKATVPLYDKTQRHLDKVSDVTRENLQGTRVIRAFNKQQYEEDRFTSSAKDLMKSSIDVSIVSTLLNPLTSIILNFAIVAILWFGAIDVNLGILTTGSIVAFINYLKQIGASLVALANVIIALIKAINCNARINEVFATKSTINDVKNPYVIGDFDRENSQYAIEFNNVSFEYKDASKPAINNLSIKIKRGETIGVIGGTGSGKSTLVNLVPRFYDATKGEIKIYNKNIKDLNVIKLRDIIGVVPQRAVLFSGTLRENMQWKKRDASDEEIYRAIEIAQAADFVKDLDGKLDFKVQAGGKNFSGGQRQRLTIARALVGNPEILILDDSASALDFATDAALRAAIKHNTKNMTVFIVSQRVNSVKNADKIIVLEHGNIVGIGTHDELINNCAIYKEISDSQTK